MTCQLVYLLPHSICESYVRACSIAGTAHWDQQELRLQYTLPLPPTSHWGSSASIDVAWLALTAGLMGSERTPVELAEMAYRV